MEIRELKPLRLVTLSCTGTQELESTFQQLKHWVSTIKHEFSNDQYLTIYHDSFRDTPPHLVRMSVGVAVEGNPDHIPTPMLQTTWAPGKCIIGKYEIQPADFGKSWSMMFAWMNQNGHKRSGVDPFERYLNSGVNPETGLIAVEFCIPIF